MPPPLAEVHSPLGPRHSLASSRQPSLLASLGFLSPVAALHMEHAMLTSALAMGARRWGAPQKGLLVSPVPGAFAARSLRHSSRTPCCERRDSGLPK